MPFSYCFFLSLYSVVSSVLITFTTPLFCFLHPSVLVCFLFNKYFFHLVFLFSLNLVQPFYIIESFSFFSERPTNSTASKIPFLSLQIFRIVAVDPHRGWRAPAILCISPCALCILLRQ
jgi:hypothetical protein